MKMKLLHLDDIRDSNCYKSIRKIMYHSNGFPAISGTGFIIRFKCQFYFCCLYHSLSDKGNFEFNKIKGLAVFYKIYLNTDNKNINDADKYLVYPDPQQFNSTFCSSRINDDLMLNEEFIPIKVIGKKGLLPDGYLDFDNQNFRNYLFQDKLPQIDETLIVCGFSLSNNEIDFDDEGNVKKVYHEARLYGGKCQKDEIGYFIKKEDENSSFQDCNGISGGIVMRMTADAIAEWVGIAIRANNDIIRFIPYHLVAKTIVKNIMERD